MNDRSYPRCVHSKISIPHPLLGSTARSGGWDAAASSSSSNDFFGRMTTIGRKISRKLKRGDDDETADPPMKFSSIREGVTLFGKTTVCIVRRLATPLDMCNKEKPYTALQMPGDVYLSRSNVELLGNIFDLMVLYVSCVG